VTRGGGSEAGGTPEPGLGLPWRVGVPVWAQALCPSPSQPRAARPAWPPGLGSPLPSPPRWWELRGLAAPVGPFGLVQPVRGTGAVFPPSRNVPGCSWDGMGRWERGGRREPVWPVPCRATPCHRPGSVLRPPAIPAPACSWAGRGSLFIYFSSLLSPFAC